MKHKLPTNYHGSVGDVTFGVDAAEQAAEQTADPNKDIVEENKNLKLEIESLKAEIADLKKPAGKAVEQKTHLSSNADNKLEDRTKGTKFEST